MNPLCVKDLEIIADNLSKAGWSYGCVSALDTQGRTIWIADAHRGDGKHFVVGLGHGTAIISIAFAGVSFLTNL